MNHFVVAAGIIANTGALADQIRNLLVGAVMSLLCVVSVIGVFVQTRSVVKAFVAFLGAAALWFAVMNMVVFRNQVGQDLNNPSGAIAVTSQRVGEIR